jgi:hypothetical protein
MVDPLEQRLDRWVNRGRRLVDGVSGTRPGSRPPARPGERRSSARNGIDGLGRWVEDKLDWLLDEEDDWQEPWQEEVPPPPARPRRPLEAISRRGGSITTAAVARTARITEPPTAGTMEPPVESAEAEGWPDDEDFTPQRWQRGASRPEPAAPEPPPPGVPLRTGRRLPRSSRRR